jgi:hypothetical protein
VTQISGLMVDVGRIITQSIEEHQQNTRHLFVQQHPAFLVEWCLDDAVLQVLLVHIACMAGSWHKCKGSSSSSNRHVARSPTSAAVPASHEALLAALSPALQQLDWSLMPEVFGGAETGAAASLVIQKELRGLDALVEVRAAQLMKTAAAAATAQPSSSSSSNSSRDAAIGTVVPRAEQLLPPLLLTLLELAQLQPTSDNTAVLTAVQVVKKILEQSFATSYAASSSSSSNTAAASQEHSALLSSLVVLLQLAPLVLLHIKQAETTAAAAAAGQPPATRVFDAAEAFASCVGGGAVLTNSSLRSSYSSLVILVLSSGELVASLNAFSDRKYDVSLSNRYWITLSLPRISGPATRAKRLLAPRHT